MQVWPGSAYPLGATYDGMGTNFSLFSEVADAVELCLFDDAGHETKIRLPEVDGFVWHGYLPGVGPGQRYGYRVHGPYDPGAGLRCNPTKLLLDPYAKAIDGKVDWHPSLFSYDFDYPDDRNDDDSAPFLPKAVVVNPYFDWGTDRPPGRPYNETVIYEAHVKGLTFLNKNVPLEMRGTYAGLSHPAMIDHLRTLGVTAIELMPVHQFIHDHSLRQRGLRNYWGYNTIGFFAPDAAYSSSGTAGQQVRSSRRWCATCTRPASRSSSTWSTTTPRRATTSARRCPCAASTTRPTTGSSTASPSTTWTTPAPATRCNVRHPHTLQLIMDSLRYWVLEMHVDGFRFDLAATLAREFYDVDRLSAFFDLVQQDPTVSQVKLIAEPWDVGPGGYQVGNFPPQWTEWNGQYRDTVRDFWRGEPATLGEFAARITGSPDLYEHSGRRPFASINFVTAHDGFTLHDLVSYNEKHNEANGEGNRDGESHNRSWNCGVEGDTDDLEVQRAAGPAAAQLHGHPVPVPGRADAAARRRDRPHPARQQQRLLPGQRHHLAGLVRGGRGPARRSPRRSRRCAGTTRCSGGAGSSTAGRCAAAGPGRRCRTSPGSPRTPGRWPRRTGRPASASRSRCSSTATASRTATPAASGSPTTRSS